MRPLLPPALSLPALLLVLAARNPSPGGVVLNEILYHPSTEKEDESTEFVEVLNDGETRVDLAGWKFEKGIAYTFPENTFLEAHGLLAVARDPDALKAVFALDPALVKGPFQGELANGGEEVTLVDAAGAAVDSVRYDDRFPWPIAADGYGAVERKGYSLERRCPGQPSGSPENWAASKKDAPTPAAANSQAGCDLPPAALAFTLSPDRVKKDDAPVLSVAFSAAEKVLAAQVEYFVDDPQKTGEPTARIPLVDEGTGGDAVAGDGVFSAAFPPKPENSIVRYRILVDGGSGLLAAYPRPEDPFAWESYFVDPGVESKNTVYHVFVSRTNWSRMESNIAGGRLVSSWDAEVPATVVSDGVVYDVGLRYGGSTFNRTNGRDATFSCPSYSGTTVVNVKSLHMQFPQYRLLRGDTKRIVLRKEWVSGFTGYHDRLSYFMFHLAGVPAPRTRFAKCYMNGCYYHFFCELEVPDENMMGRFFDDVGDLFKSVGFVGDQGPFYWGDERVIPAGGGYTAVQRYQYTYDRKSHRWKTDHSALIALIDGLNKARPKGTAVLRDFLATNFDVEECLNYLATVNYIVPWDDMWQNHYLYQRAGDGKWLWMAWDLDQTMGGPCCCADVSAGASIYRGANRTDVGNRSDWWSILKDSFFIAMPDEYLARIATLSDRLYPPEVLLAAIDGFSAELGNEADSVPVGSWGTDPHAMEAIIRRFVNDRWRYINSLVVAAKLGPAVRVRTGETVDFDTAGSKPPPGPDVTYTWSNGMTGAHPQATFGEAGIQHIALTISLPAMGASATAERIVRVVGTDAPPFLGSEGKVVLEAESFTLKLAVKPADDWIVAAETPGFSGSGYVTSKGTTRFTATGYTALAPEILFPVRFDAPGTYRVWLRARGKTTSADSVTVALDGAALPTSHYFQTPLGTDFVWSTGLSSAGPIDFVVSAGGPPDHLFSIFVREPGIEVDKVILSSDASYVPEGDGPPQSGRVWQPGRLFVRGDSNGDGTVDISDPIALVLGLFLAPGGIPCEDAADANDDGVLNITDAIFTLEFIYLAGERIPPPYSDPGLDPTNDDPFTCGDPPASAAP